MNFKYLDNIFLKHPRERDVTYIQHFVISINFAKTFFMASIKSIIHAFIPILFVTSSTDCIKDITIFMDECYRIR